MLPVVFIPLLVPETGIGAPLEILRNQGLIAQEPGKLHSRLRKNLICNVNTAKGRKPLYKKGGGIVRKSSVFCLITYPTE